jgi:hypothetical protein
VHTGSGAPAFSISVSDGSADSAPLQASVQFLASPTPATVANPASDGGSPAEAARAASPAAQSVQAPAAAVAGLAVSVQAATPAATTAQPAHGPAAEAAPAALAANRTGEGGGAPESSEGVPADAVAVINLGLPRFAGARAGAEPTPSAAQTDAPRPAVRLALLADGDTGFRLLVLDGLGSGPTLAGFADSSRGTGDVAFSVVAPPADKSDGAERLREFLVDAAKVGGLTFTVGAVWWVLRMSGVFTALLTSLPAWWQVDPLLVLGDAGQGRGRERMPPAGDPSTGEAAREERAVRELLTGS